MLLTNSQTMKPWQKHTSLAKVNVNVVGDIKPNVKRWRIIMSM